MPEIQINLDSYKCDCGARVDREYEACRKCRDRARWRRNRKATLREISKRGDWR